MIGKRKKIETVRDAARAIEDHTPKYKDGIALLVDRMWSGRRKAVRRSTEHGILSVYFADYYEVDAVRVEGGLIVFRNHKGEEFAAGLPPMLDVFVKAFNYGAFPQLAWTAAEHAEYHDIAPESIISDIG